MKGTFFSRPLEWNIETSGESWQQGESLKGTLKVKNHGIDKIRLEDMGVALAYADIKKVHARADDAFRPELKESFNGEISPGETAEIIFSFPLGSNSPVTDKRASYYLGFGKNFSESNLQVKVLPNALFMKIVGLMDTFQRFKLKEFKGSKKGVEFKLIPPTSREMANIESLLLTFLMDGENLHLKFDFQVKKLDHTSVTTKITKEVVTVEKLLMQKQYSLGKDMINQDQLLKNVEDVLSEIKIKAVF
jgi:hypothetical protein